MALAIFCTMPVTFLIILGGRKLQLHLFDKQVDVKLEASSQIQEYLEGIKIIKSCGLGGSRFRCPFEVEYSKSICILHLQLLLFLYLVDVKKEKQREIYTSPQVEVVKEIHKMLISDLQKRPTIEELSKKYLINTATLKDTFKGIYGQPIGTYMKEYRIKQAAILLRQTQATIAEIANQVGYENQSKFATAFRDVLKIAPAEYRKQNSGD